MGISVLFTGLAIAAVLVVVGYRVFRNEGAGRPPAEASVKLPAGARVLATSVGDNRIVLTVEVGGVTELHVFDLQTLAPRGRLKLDIGP